MKRQTFDELKRIHSELDSGALASEKDGRLAGIFVPWAGTRLKKEGGIYFVGMATHGEYWADAEQTFDKCLEYTQSCCNTRDGAGSPFWQFVDGLTWALLGNPFDKTSDRWGWSNIFKIGWSLGNPNQWRPPVGPKIKEDQKKICIASLREEFSGLHDTLVVIASGSAFDEFDTADLFPDSCPAEKWKRDFEGTGVWFFDGAESGNRYVYCEHPGYAVHGWPPFWGSALGRIIHLAREMPRFA